MRFQLIKGFLGVSHADVLDPVVLIRFAPSVQLKRMKRSAFCQSGISFRHIKAIYTGIFGIFLVLLAHIS